MLQGLKLLRLPPPQSRPAPVREAWGPNQHKATMYRRSESYKKSAEPTVQLPQRNLNQYNTQTQSYTSSDRVRQREAVRLPPAPNVEVLGMGFPLLRLPPDFQIRPIQLPRTPLSVSIKQHTAETVARGSFSKPQLLRVEPAPSRTVSTTHLHFFKASLVQSGWA